MKKKLLALYSLKFNPFSAEIPTPALFLTPATESFCWRIENQVGEGGFALVSGEPGSGKSAALRILTDRLHHPDLLPIASRIRTRLRMEPLPPQKLRECFVHILTKAGNPNLMNAQVQIALCECGRCGRRLRVYYQGRYSTPGYYCSASTLVNGRGAYCLRVGGIQIDEAVARAFLDTVAPAGIEAALVPKNN